MTRSPLFYPLNRGMDAEAGGVADLQTDVMRFIAILALCLVAIFALVQSIPLMPTIPQPQAPQTETTPAPKLNQETSLESPAPVRMIEAEQVPAPVEEKPLLITRPVPQRIPERPAPQTVVARTISTIAPQPSSDSQADKTVAKQESPVLDAPVATQSEGFTLLFETDLALTRLVARNEVGLYAITPQKSLKMNVNRGSLSFWPASVPKQFHEMDEATVPEGVLGALRRAGSAEIGDVKWGVTLPKNMRSELDALLRNHHGGSLIIGGDGSLRLEP